MSVIRIKRVGCDCTHCPLEGMPIVHSACGISNPSIVIIGEAPGKEESDGEVKASWETKDDYARRERGPFIGPASGRLKAGLGEAGLMWHTIYRMNVINCRPENNDISSDDAQEAIKCCSAGFKHEIAKLTENRVVFIPVGNTALHALGINGTISQNRGSVYQFNDKGSLIIPTYHPSYILRGATKEEGVWVADLTKARDLSRKDYTPPKENFNIHPTVQDVKDFVKKVVKNKSLLGVDIETDGGLNPDFNQITMIGLSTSAEDAIVIPFLRGGVNARKKYWTLEDEICVRKEIQKAFDNCPTMYQNAMFDVEQMEAKGYRIPNIQHDTMLLHHAIHPELPHDLGYIVSIYGETPTWKDVTKNSKSRMIELDEDTIRIYNARDSVVLHQILKPLLEDLKDTGTERTYYEWSLQLIRPLIDMKRYGVVCDADEIEALRKRLTKQCSDLLRQIQEDCQIPASFNFGSNPQMRYLLYGIEPVSLNKYRAQKYEIDKSEKRSKTTKVYMKLRQTIDAYEDVEPLYKTKSKARTADVESLQSIQQAACGRLEAISFLTRRTSAHQKEELDIKRLLRFLELYQQYSEIEKLRSTYTKHRLGKDGRIHATAKIHGTATGRLSMSEPNLQNQPKSVRYVFVAAPGKVLVEADYSNLELRVLAYVTGEPFLIDAFDKGQKIHKVNCRLFWNIEEDDPSWEKKYRVTKSVIFGSNYGGGKPGLYKRAMADVPGMDLSFGRFSEIVDAYFAKMVKYSGWQQSVRDVITGKAKEEPWGGYRWITNAFGRKRIFLGSIEEIEREALNTPIQGTAADIANKALIDLYWKLAENPMLHAHEACAVHDSILVECDEGKENEVAKLMKQTMEQPFIINGVPRVFPVDIKIGKNWGKMQELKED